MSSQPITPPTQMPHIRRIRSQEKQSKRQAQQGKSHNPTHHRAAPFLFAISKEENKTMAGSRIAKISLLITLIALVLGYEGFVAHAESANVQQGVQGTHGVHNRPSYTPTESQDAIDSYGKDASEHLGSMEGYTMESNADPLKYVRVSRRGVGLKRSSGSFTMSSGNRAGNSEVDEI